MNIGFNDRNIEYRVEDNNNYLKYGVATDKRTGKKFPIARYFIEVVDDTYISMIEDFLRSKGFKYVEDRKKQSILESVNQEINIDESDLSNDLTSKAQLIDDYLKDHPSLNKRLIYVGMGTNKAYLYKLVDSSDLEDELYNAKLDKNIKGVDIISSLNHIISFIDVSVDNNLDITLDYVYWNTEYVAPTFYSNKKTDIDFNNARWTDVEFSNKWILQSKFLPDVGSNYIITSLYLDGYYINDLYKDKFSYRSISHNMYDTEFVRSYSYEELVDKLFDNKYDDCRTRYGLSDCALFMDKNIEDILDQIKIVFNILDGIELDKEKSSRFKAFKYYVSNIDIFELGYFSFKNEVIDFVKNTLFDVPEILIFYFGSPDISENIAIAKYNPEKIDKEKMMDKFQQMVLYQETRMSENRRISNVISIEIDRKFESIIDVEYGGKNVNSKIVDLERIYLLPDNVFKCLVQNL